MRTRKPKVTQVPAMTYARRIGIYYRQNGVWRLTPRQRRRLEHKANAGRTAA